MLHRPDAAVRKRSFSKDSSEFPTARAVNTTPRPYHDRLEP